MNQIRKTPFLVMLSVLLASASGYAPAQAARSQSQASRAQGEQQDLQSVSGQITSLSGRTFTLAMNSTSGQMQNQDGPPQTQTRSLTFTIDANTAVTGKLAVGADTDVIYRTQDGENIAVSVRVR